MLGGRAPEGSLEEMLCDWDGDLSSNNLTLLKVSHHPKEMQSSAV